MTSRANEERMTSRANEVGSAAAARSISEEERAIRTLVATWLDASMANDLNKVLTLMTDDVIFMVPGREPFGKEEFAAGARAMKDTQMEAKGDVEEIRVLGDWAWCRTHLKLTLTPPDGKKVRRAGYTMTILRKQPGGWAITRDANLLTTQS
jgi:uncharacterized protein (TIGR02246 family)